jgi:hypothetical protein
VFVTAGVAPAVRVKPAVVKLAKATGQPAARATPIRKPASKPLAAIEQRPAAKARAVAGGGAEDEWEEF